MSRTEATAASVAEAVAEALGLDVEEVTSESTLLGDLGAESIDLLDILFRVERATGVKISAGDLAAHVQGGIPDDVFGDENDVITAVGLAHLQHVMPQIDVDRLAGVLRADGVMGLFTVDNLVLLVERRLSPQDPDDIVGADRVAVPA